MLSTSSPLNRLKAERILSMQQPGRTSPFPYQLGHIFAFYKSSDLPDQFPLILTLTVSAIEHLGPSGNCLHKLMSIFHRSP